ncbi:MAG TPA: MBL fold metallo-hydrolase [Thermoplasmata archaeon]|nr:MBL fold metallo-hydrolase [Thermoplasmata archaeon]
MYTSSQYEFPQLADGVWAAIARPGAGATSNSGIVDTGRAALVFDTSMTPKGAHEIRTAARILSGKEPLEVVNSHWHLDHTLGNRVFGGCTIRSTFRTLEMIERRAAPVADQVNDPSWGRFAAAAENRRNAETRPLYRAELECEAAARRDLEAGRGELELRAPDEVFRERYVYPGGRGLLLVEGAGHSESDTALYVPEADVLFTGDLVVSETHPDLSASDPERWLKALTGVEATKPKFIVPGHGPVADVLACATLRSYLGQLAELAAEPGDAEMPPEFAEFRRPSLFPGNVQRLREPPPDRAEPTD